MQSMGPDFWLELCDKHKTTTPHDGDEELLTIVLKRRAIFPLSTGLAEEKPLRSIKLKALDLIR